MLSIEAKEHMMGLLSENPGKTYLMAVEKTAPYAANVMRLVDPCDWDVVCLGFIHSWIDAFADGIIASQG